MMFVCGKDEPLVATVAGLNGTDGAADENRDCPPPYALPDGLLDPLVEDPSKE